MYTTPALLHSSTQFRRLVHSLAALALLIAVLGSNHPAHAWYYSTVKANAGSVTLPTIYVGDLLMPAGYTAFTLYGNAGPYAYRSPGSTGGQILYVNYYIQKWNGSSWVTTTTSPAISRQISSSQAGVRFPAPYIQPTATVGYFRFGYLFQWFTAGGAFLGLARVDSNLKSDHVCVTKARPCVPVAGYFWSGPLY